MELFFDTETTGVPKNYRAPVSDVDNYPRLVQLGYILFDGDQVLLEEEVIILPDGFTIPEEASNVHGITTGKAIDKGVPIGSVLSVFGFWLQNCDLVVGHNVNFDMNVVGAEFWRMFEKNPFEGKRSVCTMLSSVDFCAIPGKFRGKFKYPKLHELYRRLFNEEMGAAHTALQDIQNTAKCYRELVRLGVIKL